MDDNINITVLLILYIGTVILFTTTICYIQCQNRQSRVALQQYAETNENTNNQETASNNV